MKTKNVSCKLRNKFILLVVIELLCVDNTQEGIIAIIECIRRGGNKQISD